MSRTPRRHPRHSVPRTVHRTVPLHRLAGLTAAAAGLAGIGLVAVPAAPVLAGPASVSASVECANGEFTITWQVANDETAGTWTNLAGTLSGGATGPVAFGQTTLAQGAGTTATTTVAGSEQEAIVLHATFDQPAGPATNDIAVLLSADCPQQGSQFVTGAAVCSNAGVGDAVAGGWLVTWDAYNLVGDPHTIVSVSETNVPPLEPSSFTPNPTPAGGVAHAESDAGQIAALTSVSASVSWNNEAFESATIRIQPGACVPPAVRSTTTSSSAPSTTLGPTTSVAPTTTRSVVVVDPHFTG